MHPHAFVLYCDCACICWAGYTSHCLRLLQVVSAQLSDDQAAALLRMRRQYLHNLGALMRRRAELSAVLKARSFLATRHHNMHHSSIPCTPSCLPIANAELNLPTRVLSVSRN